MESQRENEGKGSLLGYVIGGAFGIVVVGAFAIWFALLPKGSTNARVANVVPLSTTDSAEAVAVWQSNGSANAAPDQRAFQLVALNVETGEWESARRTAVIPADEPGRLIVVAAAWTEAMAESGALSEDAGLLSAFIDGSGRAYLNFTDGFARDSAGLSAELEIVESLSKTLRANFPTLNDAQLLANGSETKSLGGQLDVSHPINLGYFAELD